MIPTLFTLGNLVAGFAAIYYASKPIEYETQIFHWTGLTVAGVLIFVGLVVDGVDGAVARLTRSMSPIGAQLDSLCDLVTFGVAPAYLALRLVIIHVQRDETIYLIGPEADSVYGKIIWGIAAMFVCCAALRLARFNVESSVMTTAGDKRAFKGLPTPGAAGTIASLTILHQHLLVTKFAADVPKEFVAWTSLIVPFVMLLCTFAMVSAIPYIHFTNRFIRGTKSYTYIARVVIVLALAIWWLQESLAIAFTAYALSGPAVMIFQRFRRPPPQAMDEHPNRAGTDASAEH